MHLEYNMKKASQKSRKSVGVNRTNFQALMLLRKQTVKYFYVLLVDTILCSNDKLFLTDSTGDSQIPVCGYEPRPLPQSDAVTLKGGDVSFHFTTDESESGRGFQATYKLIDKSRIKSKYSRR